MYYENILQHRSKHNRSTDLCNSYFGGGEVVNLIGWSIFIALLAYLYKIVKYGYESNEITGLTKCDFKANKGIIKECNEIRKGVYKLTIE